jgi:NTE family protein
MMRRSNYSNAPIPVKLAMQGGGAHGAFTWGVLDRLLEIPGFAIEAISATSSGAMNAAAVAQGWHRGGAAGAREALEAFWQAVARHNAVANWWAAAAGMFEHGHYWPQVARPPLPFNPMRALIEEFFDLDALAAGPIQLHLAATRVRDGALALFTNQHLTHDMLLASACLPQWFPAVEIAGDAYWDGGFAGNPALEPLLTTGCDDLLCVLLQPLEPTAVPRLSHDIAELSAQLSFSAAFKRELRDLALARKRIGHRFWPGAEDRRLRRLRMHVITPTDTLTQREGHSAVNTQIHRLLALRDLGRGAAEGWCGLHLKDLGYRESFSLSEWAAEPVVRSAGDERSPRNARAKVGGSAVETRDENVVPD